MSMRSERGGRVSLSCDNCPEVEEFEAGDYAAARKLAAESGWECIMVEGEFQDLCPECAEEAFG